MKPTLTVAKNAGFCFGVSHAVQTVEDLIKRGKSVCTLGPIIHNPVVVRRLQRRGVCIVDSPKEVPSGAVMVIRSHGVPRNIYELAQEAGVPIADATCPFVQKIHRLIAEHTRNGAVALIAGDVNHPEVMGIRGHCFGPSFVFSSLEELYALFRSPEGPLQSSSIPVILVAQTTFRVKIWQECVKFAEKHYTNLSIFDTICNATAKRQQEAERLSEESDLMVIVGGRTSSNTAKLRDVCALHCRTLLVETAEELTPASLCGARRIGITAGASTPDDMIKEVLTTMTDIINNESAVTNSETPATESEISPATETASEAEMAAETQTAPEAEAPTAEDTASDAKEEDSQPETGDATETHSDAAKTDAAPDESETEPEEKADSAAESEKSMDDMSFEEALEASLQGLSTGEKVHGRVVSVSPNEVQVEVIGRKQTGYISADELSSDPNANPADIVKVGDELELLIMRTNDQEGTIMLSKKRIDNLKGWDTIVAAEKSGDILEGTVTDIIKGGMLVKTLGIRIFVPASQASVNRMEDLSPLKGQKVRLRIIEVNQSRHRAVGSVRSVEREERKEREAAFWAQAEVGQKYTGVVKSLTSYGAFVDIGGVDGMIHVSELSWGRVKHPQDVVSVGDTVEVTIKGLDTEKHKISLGYRKAEDNPWEKFKSEFSIGDVVKAKIVGMTAFGAFAQLLPGVDGLIHISQITDHRVERPQDELKIGQEVLVKIIGVDYDKKRISLSMRALIEEGISPIPQQDAPQADSEVPGDTDEPKEDSQVQASE